MRYFQDWPKTEKPEFFGTPLKPENLIFQRIPWKSTLCEFCYDTVFFVQNPAENQQ